MIGYILLSVLLLGSIFGLIPIPFLYVIGAIVVWAVFHTWFAPGK